MDFSSSRGTPLVAVSRCSRLSSRNTASKRVMSSLFLRFPTHAVVVFSPVGAAELLLARFGFLPGSAGGWVGDSTWTTGCCALIPDFPPVVAVRGFDAGLAFGVSVDFILGAGAGFGFGAGFGAGAGLALGFAGAGTGGVLFFAFS